MIISLNKRKQENKIIILYDRREVIVSNVSGPLVVSRDRPFKSKQRFMMYRSKEEPCAREREIERPGENE